MADGTLCSLRFRCFETKRRWALDVKERKDGEWQALKGTAAGLMSVQEAFDPDICLDRVLTFWIEGETDLLGGVSMLIRAYGKDPCDWPARVIALPGVGSCHELALAVRPTKTNILFFDGDAAAIRACFWHRRQRRVTAPDGSTAFEPNLDEPPEPGLVAKMQAEGRECLVAYPPVHEKKYDLRDMCNDGWTYEQFVDHCRRTGTADPHGRRIGLSRQKARLVHEVHPPAR